MGTHFLTAMLVRNEADKYLARVVEHHRQFGPVLVLDDHSTDNSPQVAKKAGATVKSLSGEGPMWGKESHARQVLWDWAAEEAGNGWVYISDADHILHGDPRPLTSSWLVNTWCFRLYDCWDDETTYRADGYWQGYQHPRAWMFRPKAVPQGWKAAWPTRGVHCGHAPVSWPMIAGVAPPDIFIQHLAYVTREARQAKFARYQAVWEQLSDHERSHASSILD